ncbi:MAG: maleylacetoacetate isomerase [Gammaproteobacteria bacterium]|jgi:maleylacetoacetate isomerase
MSLILYSYWRSSAAYRVRIALNVLGLEHEIRPVHLVRDGGEQHFSGYRDLNPQGLVPTLVDGDVALTQSLAILEYLAEQHPSPALLPPDPVARAHARQIAALICTDIHPLNNLRVLQYLENELYIDQDARDRWYRHWIGEGFQALEQLLRQSREDGPYCLGEDLSIADVCLVPQVYNAHRFKMDMAPYPTLAAVEKACLELEAFRAASPEQQADAPKNQ